MTKPAETKPPPQYLSTTEAAALVGVAPATVREWIREGRLTGYKVGGRLVKINRDDLPSVFETLGPQGPTRAEKKAAKKARTAAQSQV
jgi:excisionase family DNA binding protein